MKIYTQVLEPLRSKWILYAGQLPYTRMVNRKRVVKNGRGGFTLVSLRFYWFAANGLATSFTIYYSCMLLFFLHNGSFMCILAFYVFKTNTLRFSEFCTAGDSYEKNYFKPFARTIVLVQYVKCKFEYKGCLAIQLLRW